MDHSESKANIAAVVTQDQHFILGGGVPVFVVSNSEELQQLAGSLERILDSSAHELNKHTIIIVSR
jgi:hypothetical protein